MTSLVITASPGYPRKITGTLNEYESTDFNMASEWLVAAKMGELLASDRFDKDSITEKDLSLSQAFCLLWQNQDTGDVAGRQSPNAMTDTASAAVLLDLYVLEKIDLEKEIKQWMDKKRQVIMVKVGILRKN